MSLRREQAELQRALELSTQQAAVLSHLPPYTLSSATTSDSRDLELRPAAVAVAVPTVMQSSSSMPSTSTPNTSSATPLRSRPAYPVSPDSPQRKAPRTSLVGVVVPRCGVREGSRDPIDLLDFDDHEDTGVTTTIPLSIPPLPSSSLERPSASGSSSTAAGNQRVSARVQKKKEDEAAAAAERKRKRAEKKAREAAEKAELQRRIDAGEIEPPEDNKRKRQRTVEPKAKVTKVVAPKTSQSTGSESSQRRQPLSHPVHENALQTPVNLESSTPMSTNSNSTSSGMPPSKSPGVQAARQPPSSLPSPTKSSSTPQTANAPSPSSSPDQPTTPAAAATEAEAVMPAVATPTTPVPRPLQPSKSTPGSGPSTPGPNGYKWKTARNDLNSVLSKFPRARPTGMSKRLKIQSLHSNIGPGKAAPPPPPPKRKPKVESDDDDDDDPNKVKVGSREWLMMED